MVRSAVRVAVRTRPTSHFAHDELEIASDGQTINVHLGRKESGGAVNNAPHDYSFRVDKVLHNTSQEGVFEECGQDVVDSVLQGYNGTLMAYGQTGAGKTFTMSGGLGSYEYRGLIPRSLNHLFAFVNNHPETAFSIRVSYLEIYNESLFDLLSPTFGAGAESSAQPLHGDTHLQIQEDATGNITVRGLSQHVANTEEEALTLFFEGEANRVVAEHTLNSASSRSHCVFQVMVESRSRIESAERAVRSKLNLVDLAGSERVGKTNSQGTTLKEAGYINKSLSFLEQVVVALSTPNRDHVPYRQSRLTYLLKDSIGGNCKTTMIANVWGEHAQLDETLSTLKFATRMMRVSNDAIVNIQQDPELLIRQFERQVRELKQELAMHDQLASRSHVEYEPYTEEQRLELREAARSYLCGESEALEIVSLRHVKELFLQFRSLYQNLEAEVEHRIRNQYVLQERSSDSAGAGGSASGNSAGHQGTGVGESGEGSGVSVGIAAPAAVVQRGGKAGKKGGKVGKKGASASSPEGSAVSPSLSGEGPSGLPVSASPVSEESSIPSVPNYKDAYEEYKHKEGQETFLLLKKHMAAARDNKSLSKDLAKQVNHAKREIDNLKTLLQQKQEERDRYGQAPGDGSEIVIDEEEFEYIQRLKEMKRTYRDSFEHLREVRKETNYILQNLIPGTREQLVREFERWFEDMYGAKPFENSGALDPSSPAKALHFEETATPRSQLTVGSELKDEGEKFEELEMQRILEKDPDALPYYNAQKQLSLARAKAGKRGKEARLASSVRRR